MNPSDAQGILGLNAVPKDEGAYTFTGLTDVDKKTKGTRTTPQLKLKRPEGMHRELFNLLDKDKDISSLVPSSSKNSGYRNQKARIGIRYARRWEWRQFANPARSDGLQLHHWQRVDDAKQSTYPFANFNKVISIPTFTDEEYDECLNSAKWSKQDTLHLFDLCRQFDLRWVVIADRWEGSMRPTIEEMKERFYNGLNELFCLRGDQVDLFCYDAEHEKRRKEQLVKQWNRSQNEIDEEEMLLAELKRIEIRKRERERKAQDLQKLITAGDRQAASASTALSASSPAVAVKKKTVSRPQKASSTSLPYSTIDAYINENSSLRFPEFRSAGAHLRSHEMKLPSNLAQKKMKTIDTVIQKLKLDMLPVGDEDIVGSFNDFRSSVILLQQLKHALQAAEFELESLKTRYTAATGKTFEIEPRMRASSSGASMSGGAGAPSSKRTITDFIELPNSLSIRKRKLPFESAATRSSETKRI